MDTLPAELINEILMYLPILDVSNCYETAPLFHILTDTLILHCLSYASNNPNIIRCYYQDLKPLIRTLSQENTMEVIELLWDEAANGDDNNTYDYDFYRDEKAFLSMSIDALSIRSIV